MFWSFKFKHKLQTLFGNSKYSRSRQYSVLLCILLMLTLYRPNTIISSILVNAKEQSSNTQHSNTSNNYKQSDKHLFPLASLRSDFKILSGKKSIVLHAFDEKFHLNLESSKQYTNFIPNNINIINDKNDNYAQHISDQAYYKNSKLLFNPTRTSDSLHTGVNECIFVGYVNEDSESNAFLNMCHEEQLIGSFRVNKTDYFIEPDEEFSTIKQTPRNLLQNTTNFIKTEISYALIDGTIATLQTHSIYKRKLHSIVNSLDSCILLGDDNENSEASNQRGTYNKTLIWDELDLNESESSEAFRNELKRGRRSYVGDQHNYPYVMDRKVYLELLVVVDKKMKDYYGENLENHILTLIFLTTQMYQHPSIVNPVRIYLTDIIYISELEPKAIEDLHVIWDAEKTLSSFCSWQSNFVNKNDLIKPDLSILVTKDDICKSREVCQTLGMAKLGQVCIDGQNCALIEDSGVNTAYTIAHEIGHLVGMKHAKESRCKFTDSSSTQMMASVLDLTKTEYEWSNCSVMELNDFLRLDTASCLFNEPVKKKNADDNAYRFEDTLEQFSDVIKLKATFPGELQAYELKHQCQQVFGPESDVCDHNLDSDCKVLWCKAGYRNMENAAIQCVTTNTKWADGTACGIYESGYQFRPHKICMNGNCVLKSSEEARVIDGQWSHWGEFTECSRSCGGGIKKRYRSCNNPKPKNGGKYCIGERFDYVSCRIQKCPDESDFRDLQCVLAAMKPSTATTLKLNGFIDVNSNMWKAYHSTNPRKQCSLMCMPENSSNFAVLDKKVVDGTKCGPETNDVCVDGFCLPAGCDNILYSNKKLDNCGICDGNSSSCYEVSQTIDAPTTYGYNRVFDIPSKATNIHIIRKRSGNDLGCLALRTNRENVYILNGHYVISKSTLTTKFEGIRIDYIVNDSKEIIKSDGNFSQTLQVQFLAGSMNSKSDNGVIKYLYFVQRELPTSSEHKRTAFGHSSDMSKSIPLKYIQNKSGQLRSQTGIETVGKPCNKICNGIEIIQTKAPDGNMFIERPCNMHCKLHLFSSPGHCKPTKGICGPGIELPTLRCIKHEKLSNQGYEVDLNNCDQYEIFRTNTTYSRDCEILCVFYKWKEIDSSCSVTCGEGQKFRYYKCFDLRTKKLVDSVHCGNIVKPDSAYVKCNQTCYKWQTSSWTSCSKSCGGGLRIREIYCVFNHQNVVENSYCSSIMPISNEKCNDFSCPTWVVNEWSSCSCVSGKRKRIATCMFKGRKISPTECYSLSKPFEEEPCRQSGCPVWKVGLWTSCSASCGTGFKQRDIYCSIESRNFSENAVDKIASLDAISRLVLINSQLTDKRVEDFKCNQNDKPESLVECSINRECYEWRTSYWTACSVTCGHGIRMRRVYCSGRLNDCADLPKPDNIEKCVQPPCFAEWQTGEWSKCHGNCKFGWKTRDVRCVDKENNTLVQYYCAAIQKPFHRQHCINCGTWKAEKWSECSISCGQGFQSRNVNCYSDQLEILANENCYAEEKPDLMQKCTRVCAKEPDYQWKIVSYGKCSVKCGTGWKFRHIECQTKYGQPSNLCPRADKPKYYEQCTSGACPKWDHGDWSICSTRCGSGSQRRLVVCREINGTILSDSFCNHLAKPDDTMDCFGSSCGTWTHDEWSNCDLKSCTNSRQIKCISNSANDMPEAFCDISKRPISTQQCNNTNDCEKYQKYLVSNYNHSLLYTGVVTYTNWSSCSAKCGKGNQTRDVLCLFASKQSIILPISYCDTKEIESTLRQCEVNQCQYRLIQKWGRCSKACNKNGIQIYEQKCLERYTRKYHNLSLCGIIDEPKNRTRPCFNSCMRYMRHYIWRVKKWSECSRKCGLGTKTRRIFCWNKQFNRSAHNSKCSAKYEPSSTIPCMNISCGHSWFVSKWSKCSTKCGFGNIRRNVTCIQVSEEGEIVHKTSDRCDANDRPVTHLPCNFGKCGGEYFWKPSKWSSCSPKCGFGVQKRFAYCENTNGTKLHPKFCNNDNIPIKSQLCFTNCYSNSCFDLKQKLAIRTDGDYKLNVSNRIVLIYCHNMDSRMPLEFLTLKSGESQNFAEIYEKKLIEPNKCLFGPRYGASCSFCTNETVPNHGITLYSKVRIDINKLRIIENDFTFARVKYGNRVPFGTAGDCYSSASDCQQARFNINLRGTNFVLTKAVKWVNHGEKPFSRIHFSRDKSTVYGGCGGMCGFCRPDPYNGIQLEVA